MFWKKYQNYSKSPKKIEYRKLVNTPKFLASSSFLETWEWKRLRYQFLMERGSVCECCGNGPYNGVRICVDHVKPRSKHPELALDISNLQILCEDCNKGKGNIDTTNWHKVNEEFKAFFKEVKKRASE